MTPLNPTVLIGDMTYMVMSHLPATLTVAGLGERIGSLSMMRGALVRAVTTLLTGVRSRSHPQPERAGGGAFIPIRQPGILAMRR